LVLEAFPAETPLVAALLPLVVAVIVVPNSLFTWYSRERMRLDALLESRLGSTTRQ
jgi:hypothetical protein